MESRLRNNERKAKQETLTTDKDEQDFVTLNKFYKIPKVSPEEKECRQILKDSGVDFKGMTKEEMFNIAEAIRLSKQDAPHSHSQGDPYEADTQEDPHSQSGSPGYIPSKFSSQEFDRSGVETGDTSQSDPGGSPTGNDVDDMTVPKEHSGRLKSVGRRSFRLSPSSTDDEGNIEGDPVNVRKEKTDTSGEGNGLGKSSDTPTNTEGMFGKVIRSCKRAAAFLTPKKKTLESPVIIPDSPENDIADLLESEPKAKKTSKKRSKLDSSDDDDEDFVPEKPKTTATSKRIKLMTSKATDVKEDTKQHEIRQQGSPANSEIEFRYFLQDLAEKNNCNSLDEYNSKRREHVPNGRQKNSIPLFAPNIEQIVSYTKVILQEFEIYHRKLVLQQSKSRIFLKMGETVKTGQHAENTIDIKRRGYHSVEFPSSADGDDFGVEKSEYGQFSLDDGDDGEMKTRPDKIIGRPLRFTKSRRRVNQVKNEQKETVNKHVDNEDDDDMVEVSDKGSQVDDLDVELMDYFQEQDKENLPEVEQGEKLEEQLIENRHTPDILMEEDTFPSLIKKPAPRSSGKTEKQLEFNVKALRKRAVKCENDDLEIFERSQCKIPKNPPKSKFKRHHSNISTASSDSSRMEEDFIQELAKKDKLMKMGTAKPTKDGEILLNSHGDVYATQMCAMEEKHSKEFDSKEQISKMQSTEDYFDIDGDEDETNTKFREINGKKLIQGPNCVVEIENSVDMSTDKMTSFGEIITDNSDEEILIAKKPESKQRTPKQETRSCMQEGEVKLNVKRRGGPGRTRKIQHPAPDVDDEVSASGGDVKAETDDEWLSARNGGKEKQGIKTYSKRAKGTGNTQASTQVKEKVSCPMCYKKFDSEHIETHAAECQGEVGDNEQENVDTEGERVQELLSSTPTKSSVEHCVLCDQPLPHGYEGYAHPHCMAEATQAQEIADKGVHNTQTEEPRKTRSRGRQPKSTHQNVDHLNMFVLDDD